MKLTKTKLSELLKTQCDLNLPKEKITKMIFRSFIKDEGRFQLTYKGFQLLKYAKFQSYKIRMNKPITMKAMLNLDRQCPCPYYLPKKKNYVYLFAQKPAVVLQMLDGDLENFHL